MCHFPSRCVTSRSVTCDYPSRVTFRHAPSHPVPSRPDQCRHIMFRHIPLRHVPSHHVPSRHVPSRHVPSRQVPSRCVTLRHVTLRQVTFRHTIHHVSRFVPFFLPIKSHHASSVPSRHIPSPSAVPSRHILSRSVCSVEFAHAWVWNGGKRRPYYVICS